MDNKLFTEESKKQFSRAERESEYNRTASPKIWILLIGISVFLVGFIVWVLFGQIDISVKVTGLADNGTLYMFAEDEDLSKELESAIYIRVDGQDYLVTNVDIETDTTASISSLVFIESDDCSNLEDDVYDGYAILGTCSPFTLIFGSPLDTVS